MGIGVAGSASAAAEVNEAMGYGDSIGIPFEGVGRIVIVVTCIIVVVVVGRIVIVVACVIVVVVVTRGGRGHLSGDFCGAVVLHTGIRHLLEFLEFRRVLID